VNCSHSEEKLPGGSAAQKESKTSEPHSTVKPETEEWKLLATEKDEEWNEWWRDELPGIKPRAEEGHCRCDL